MSAIDEKVVEAREIVKAYDEAMACQGEHAHDAKLIVMANYGDLAIGILRALTAAQPLMENGGWRYDTENMPSDGSFEALGANEGVHRWKPDEQWVVVPKTGRMFMPYAWRPTPPRDPAINSHEQT